MLSMLSKAVNLSFMYCMNCFLKAEISFYTAMLGQGTLWIIMMLYLIIS